jgi:predicted Holliday junction resolvase-like endonuclease
MEITSFVLGMLTVVAVIIVAVIIRGIVKITQLEKQLEETQESIEWGDRNHLDTIRDIHERLSRMDEHAFRHLEELKREITSYVDSRIDKLQSKSKEAPVK